MQVLWVLAAGLSEAARPTAAVSTYPLVLALATAGVITAVLVFAFVGLVAGVVVLAFRMQAARPVRTPDAIKGALGWPVIAHIRPLRGVPEFPSAMIDEADIYQRFKRALGSERPLRTILVTSPTPSRAASIVAGDLALLMSARGSRALLVDVQLGHPSQGERFGVETGPGLTDGARTLAVDEVDVASLMYPPTAVEAPHLRVVPAGAPPPDLRAALGSRSLRYILTRLAASGSDVVILDAPPFTPETGAGALADLADGVLVVVERDRARRGDVSRLRRQLLSAHARVVGCIMAEVEAGSGAHSRAAKRRSHARPRPTYAAVRR